MPDALLPCPFCGYDSAGEREIGGGFVVIRCRGCGADGAARGTGWEAILAWNRRTPTPCPPDLTTQADAEIAILRSDLRAARAERDALRARLDKIAATIKEVK